MSSTPAGWYDDGSGAGRKRWWDGQAWTDQFQPPEGSGGVAEVPHHGGASAGTRAPAGSGPSYVVLQVILKEKLWGTGSGNLTELEGVLNRQAALGYRLHTITTTASGSKGIGGGDRIQATMVFERIS